MTVAPKHGESHSNPAVLKEDDVRVVRDILAGIDRPAPTVS
jgi:hypothetical protein